ncbi:SPOR domain-containing protein [Caballeronia cordobensis]|uniref:Sporulation repeat-containing protein n=1 Tax=Caballeronia cordobensis TaxID=1353886 RepID=A0A158EYL4_CABCO|nr:SPOR domain-containing protein [Caballeronia cordobensis]BAO85194.1 sporulation domain protein [Burkholderia sp. RPE67]SAL12515.1 sporulation repeat-containing protein [Caballeronia cordobensis]
MAKPRRTSKQSKQTGGTFIGIVLGLIVGLAIAVIVALYITRAPTPFVAKVAPPPSEANSAPPAAQPYDPNRPLQGKSPGQAVPQAAQPTPPNTAPGQTNNQTQSSGMLDEPQIVEVPPSGATASAPKSGSASIAKKPETAPAAPTAPNVTSNANATPPKGGSAATAGKTTPPAPGEPNTGYFLQVGAYKTQADAEQQRARLGFQGFESRVTQRDAGGVTYYRVRVGPFAKFEDMNTARQRLSDAGVDTAVIRFSKQ